MASTAKIVEVMFEKALETYEHQMLMLGLVDQFTPNAGNMQNSAPTIGGAGTANPEYPLSFTGGAIWRPVQQHAPIIEGWDVTGEETGIVEETYPVLLGNPKNDVFKQRADDLRDLQFWERRGEQSGKRQATELNKIIAQVIATQGSLYFETAETNGYKAIGGAQAIMNERQKLRDDSRFCVLNDRDQLKFAGDLVAQTTTLQGRNESAYATGQIGSNVAEFDVYTGSFMPNIAVAGAVTDGNIDTLGGSAPKSSSLDSFVPAGGDVDAVTGAVTNVDYRAGVLNLIDATGVVVGGKYTISGVNSIGMADKTDTGQLMTFTVVAVNANAVTVYPKPIMDTMVDTSDQALYRAYANCTGDLLAGVLTPLSVVGGKANLFGAKSAIEVATGEAPIGLLNQFGGMKVISSTMSNGQTMYMAYDGNLLTLDFTCRLFTWYGVTCSDPASVGSFVATP